MITSNMIKIENDKIKSISRYSKNKYHQHIAATMLNLSIRHIGFFAKKTYLISPEIVKKKTKTLHGKIQGSVFLVTKNST